MTIAVGDPVRSADGHSLDWTIDTIEHDAPTRTRYALLRWDDIVRSRFPRANRTRLAAIPVLGCRLWRSGYFGAFWREAWQFASVILVVHLLYGMLVGASVALAALLLWATSLGGWPALLLAAPTAYAVLGLLTRLTKGRPFYVTHLVDDAAFTHEHASGGDADMRARLDAWADRIRSAEANASEVVVVGHSSSSFLAIEALDRVMASDPLFGRRGVPVTLVTLGSVIPWITLDPRAEAMRGSLRRVAEGAAIGWLDLRAPWDWLSIHLRNPLEASGLDTPDPARPTICSVDIADLIEPETVALGRWNFFRMHFQLLMSSRDPHAFDYVALIAGAEPVHRAVRALRDAPAATASAGCKSA